MNRNIQLNYPPTIPPVKQTLLQNSPWSDSESKFVVRKSGRAFIPLLQPTESPEDPHLPGMPKNVKRRVADMPTEEERQSTKRQRTNYSRYKNKNIPPAI